MFSEGRWFDSRGPKSVLGQDTEPQTAPDVLVGTLHGSHRELLSVALDKNVFTLLLHEHREERHGLLTKHWNIELFTTRFINKYNT